MNRLLYYIHDLLILIIVFTISGAFQFQLFLHEEPCPLCWLQRLGMLCVGTCALLNLTSGDRLGNYALMLLSALFGGSVATRQILLHICPGSPTFGTPFLGLSLYTWSLLLFIGVIVFVVVALLFHNGRVTEGDSLTGQKMGWLGKIAITFLGILILANLLDVSANCGWGPCSDVP